MKILADRYIPFLESMLGSVADLRLIAPEEFTSLNVRDADALIVRTRTRIDRELLAGSRVKFVATATIGYDHIDTHYLKENHIQWCSCPGCNAKAVCDYIKEAIDELHLEEGKTIGVVGVGHVGSLVKQMASARGMQVMINDAPRGIGATIDEIARKCDVLTLHVPLTYDGPFATYHLVDAPLLELMKPTAVVINAARGGIVDETALLASRRRYILDTWENEPHLSPRVLQNATLASYHIAGYSVEGKWNASRMCVEALANYFRLPILSFDKKVVSLQREKGDSAPGWLARISQELQSHPDQFEQLRKQYTLR